MSSPAPFIPHAVAAAAATRPDAPAVSAPDHILTYGQLDRQSDALADQLHELGVGPDVVVAVCLPRSAAFVMATLARLQPLLARALDRRLHLDCWIAARLLRIGPCPGRPDLTATTGGRLAFRSCVYQPGPDFVALDALTTRARLADFEPPVRCPFPYDGDAESEGQRGAPYLTR